MSSFFKRELPTFIIGSILGLYIGIDSTNENSVQPLEQQISKLEEQLAESQKNLSQTFVNYGINVDGEREIIFYANHHDREGKKISVEHVDSVYMYFNNLLPKDIDRNDIHTSKFPHLGAAFHLDHQFISDDSSRVGVYRSFSIDLIHQYSKNNKEVQQ